MALYDGKSGSTFNSLRYQWFCLKVALGIQFVQVHALPPTSAAARYHSLLVYLQVQQWNGNTDYSSLKTGVGETLKSNSCQSPQTYHQLPQDFSLSSAVTAYLIVTQSGAPVRNMAWAATWREGNVIDFIVPTPAQSQKQMPKN